MPTIRDDPKGKLGPYSKVTPTNRAGDSNADDAPQIVAATAAQKTIESRRSDLQTQMLIELRVISGLLAQGFGITDDLDALRADEDAALGNDATT